MPVESMTSTEVWLSVFFMRTEVPRTPAERSDVLMEKNEPSVRGLRIRAQISQDSSESSVSESSDFAMDIDEFAARRMTLASAKTISAAESSPVETVSPTRTDSPVLISQEGDGLPADDLLVTSPSVRLTYATSAHAATATVPVETAIGEPDCVAW